METNKLKNIVETLLFITDKPIPLAKFVEVFDDSTTKEEILQVLDTIKQEYMQAQKPMELREVANGFQFATKQEFGQWVRRLFKERLTMKLSPSAMETLSIIAYKQPITRAGVEEIRGVDVAGVLETLLERKLVRIAGRKEVPGKPLVYCTTQEFMRYFGLTSLSDLPSLEEMNKE